MLKLWTDKYTDIINIHNTDQGEIVVPKDIRMHILNGLENKTYHDKTIFNIYKQSVNDSEAVIYLTPYIKELTIIPKDFGYTIKDNKLTIHTSVKTRYNNFFSLFNNNTYTGIEHYFIKDNEVIACSDTNIIVGDKRDKIN